MAVFPYAEIFLIQTKTQNECSFKVSIDLLDLNMSFCIGNRYLKSLTKKVSNFILNFS